MNLASGDDGYHDSLLQLLRFKSISTSVQPRKINWWNGI